MRSSMDLVTVVVLAAAALALSLLDTGGPARALLALLLVGALPGYAVMAAAFGDDPPSFPEVLVLSIGSSLAIATLSGFALNLLPNGLQVRTWVELLSTVTFAGSGVALARRCDPSPIVRGRLTNGLRLSQGALFGLAGVVFVGGLLLARASALTQHSEQFTQLWLLPSADVDPTAIRLGIANRESQAMSYRVRLVEGEEILREWPRLDLAPNGRWETTVALPDTPADGGLLVAALYRVDQPEDVYRRVTWRLHDPTVPTDAGAVAVAPREGGSRVDVR